MERQLDIWAQIDRPTWSVAFGVHPDRRNFCIRNRTSTNGNRTVFIRCWAFVVVLTNYPRAQVSA